MRKKVKVYHGGNDYSHLAFRENRNSLLEYAITIFGDLKFSGRNTKIHNKSPLEIISLVADNQQLYDSIDFIVVRHCGHPYDPQQYNGRIFRATRNLIDHYNTKESLPFFGTVYSVLIQIYDDVYQDIIDESYHLKSTDLTSALILIDDETSIKLELMGLPEGFDRIHDRFSPSALNHGITEEVKHLFTVVPQYWANPRYEPHELHQYP